MRPSILILCTLAVVSALPTHNPGIIAGNLVGNNLYDITDEPAPTPKIPTDLAPERTKATLSTVLPDPNDPNPYPQKPSQPDGYYGPYWTGAGFPGGKLPEGYPTEKDWWHYRANLENGSLKEGSNFHDYFVARARGDFGPVDEEGDPLEKAEKV